MPRGNPNNLKPMNTRTKEEQKKIARMGGLASGKARAEYKDMRDSLRELLDEKTSDEIAEMLTKKIKAGNLKALEIALKMMGSDISKGKEKLEQVQTERLQKDIETSSSDVSVTVRFENESDDFGV